MSFESPSSPLPAELTDPSDQAPAENPVGAWIETALTVMFAATAVLFVSFLAVVSGVV